MNNDRPMGHYLLATDLMNMAVQEAFHTHVKTIKELLQLSTELGNPCRRDHHMRGEICLSSWTYFFYGENGTPLLVGNVFRDEARTVLDITDRTQAPYQVVEHVFFKEDFVKRLDLTNKRR